MAWVTPRTAVTGEVTTAANLNQTRDNLNYLHDPPTISVTVVSPFNVPHNTATDIEFNAEGWKRNFTHSTSSSEELVTVTEDGIYDIDPYVGWYDTSGAGIRRAEVRRNNSEIRADQCDPDTTNAATNQFSFTEALEAGDDITLVVLQDSGGDLLCIPGLKLTWRCGLA